MTVGVTDLPITVAVLGLGNPVLGDDAVGLHVAAEVARLDSERPVPGLTVLTGTRGGFELIDLLAGFTHALIVDALGLPEPTPGRVRRLTFDDVAGSARLVGAHEMNVGDAFALARTLGIPMPGHVEIFAVEAASTRTLSEEMTPAVAAAAALLARTLHARAGELAGGAHQLRQE